MLRHKILTSVLTQVLGSGTTGALLLNREGTLLAFAGYEERQACLTAALVSSVWLDNEKAARLALTQEPLITITVVCEDGILIAKEVAGVLVAVQATAQVPLGSLKSKVSALAAFLHQPLSHVADLSIK